MKAISGKATNGKPPAASKGTRRPSKIRPVPIAQMRVPPELVTQRPFQQAHTDALVAVFDLNKLGYPIINWRAEIYWILDGQHRIAALKALGFGNDVLDCEVYEDLTDPEMADIFLGRDVRRPISLFDKFHVRCTAGYRRECDIRRAVEAQGLKIGRELSERTVGAIGALGKVYDLSSDVVVGQVCRTIRDAYGGDPRSFDAALIIGLGFVFNRYNGRVNEKELAHRLSDVPQGVRGLVRRAEAQRERTGNQKTQCVAAVVVDLYNKSFPSAKRLPVWWKQIDPS